MLLNRDVLDYSTQLDINFLCYLFLKVLNSSDGATDKDIRELLKISYRFQDVDTATRMFKDYFINLKSAKRSDNLLPLLPHIEDETSLMLFNFCLKLIPLKDLLLQEAKLTAVADAEELAKHHQLSIEYDTKSRNAAWYLRVKGALLALLLFRKLDSDEVNFLSSASNDFVKKLVHDYEILKQQGLESNQILMLVFAESMSQSLKSSGGSSYEDRIIEILVSIGIEKDTIEKIHDDNDETTEYDMRFEFEGKIIGIGAKRTLRERYKQFLNASTDVVITITLGIDLNKKKARSIVDNGLSIFVADEIYNMNKFMQEIEGIYPGRDLNRATLKKLCEKSSK